MQVRLDVILLLFNCNWVDTHLHTNSTQYTEDGTHITITRGKTVTREKIKITRGKNNNYKEKIGK
jgi:hypothetical protein